MKFRSALLAAATLLSVATQSEAALVVYTSRTAWEAAVGGSFTLQDFSSFSVSSSYENQTLRVGDFTILASGTTFGSSWHNVGPVSNSNSVNGSSQINAATGDTGGTSLTFDNAILAIGGDWAGISDSRTTSLTIGTDVVAIPNLNGSFWGVVSDTPFSVAQLTLTSGAPDGFSLDNLAYTQAGRLPEPGTLSIVAAALLGLGLVRRRQR